MPVRASFDTEQNAVKICETEDVVYISICLNGEWTERKYDANEEAQRVWECDYNEIITDKGKIDVDDVKTNPERYLSWTEKTIAETIADLTNENKMLTQCLLEMSEIVYA